MWYYTSELCVGVLSSHGRFYRQKLFKLLVLTRMWKTCGGEAEGRARLVSFRLQCRFPDQEVILNARVPKRNCVGSVDRIHDRAVKGVSQNGEATGVTVTDCHVMGHF